MFNFSGCKCPVCQQPIHEKDDIVVCPECGAPYHRACYEKQGACVFSDRHGIGFEWKPAPDEVDSTPSPAANSPLSSQNTSPSEIQCPRCGAMNPSQDLFCESCGAPLRKGEGVYNSDVEPKTAASYGPGSVPEQDPFYIAGLPYEAQVHPDDEFEGIKASDWAAYLGNNAAWYLLNFKQMKVTGRKMAISFSAFLFGPYYFLYRKMWLPAAGLFAASLLLSIPDLLQMSLWMELPVVDGLSSSVLSTLIAVCSTLSLLIKFLCGGFAVNVYKKISAKRIRKILANGPVDAAVLKKAGGTSKVALFICLAVLFIAGYLFAFVLVTPAFAGGTLL